MNTDTTHEFLNLYRTLEDILSSKYSGSKRRFSNAIIQFTNDDEGRAYKEELNLFREIRNILSHHPEIDGESVIIPSESAINTLKAIIHAVENPPMALAMATPAKNLVKARPDTPLAEIMETMETRGFSHIPIMTGEIIQGVFSVSTLFSYYAKYGKNGIPDNTKVSHFAEFLPVDCHATECFKFLPLSATYYDIKDEFTRSGSRSGPKGKRLAVIFITKDGSAKNPVMGIITPWDVIAAAT
jgi:FOG: CBS domain